MTTGERVLKAIYGVIDGGELKIKPYEDAFSCICNICADNGKKDVSLTEILKGKLRKATQAAIKENVEEFFSPAFDLNKRILLWEATESFDSYILYVEINRPRDRQFYLPRRKQLKPLVDAMQELYERKIDLLAISLPPGVGKTTLALFFLTWVAGKDPDKPILTSSHNNDFLYGAYNEILRMLDPHGEYLWKDVFGPLKVIQTNAKAMMIDIGRDEKDCKRFMTLEFSSIGSGNAGKVRAQSLLYCDDLVESIEQALSKVQMDKLWTKYSVDCRQRKIGDCAELHIATRWSVNDVIGRLEEKYGNNGRSKFISIPALDENDESNFDYPIEAGFTTEFYRAQRDAMDEISWRSLYMNEPVEREGQLYIEDALRRYFELPDGEPDAIIGVCDTKDKGSDYCVLPVAYQYGNDYYIEDVLCEDYAPNIVDINLAEILVRNGVQLCQFESNAAGGKTAEKVQRMVKEKGGITKIVTKYTTQNKDTKIIVNSPWVIEHCLFKDGSVIKNNKEYRSFLYQLCSYTLKGRNAHDDTVDAMAQLALYAQNLVSGKVEIFSRPW